MVNDKSRLGNEKGSTSWLIGVADQRAWYGNDLKGWAPMPIGVRSNAYIVDDLPYPLPPYDTKTRSECMKAWHAEAMKMCKASPLSFDKAVEQAWNKTSVFPRELKKLYSPLISWRSISHKFTSSYKLALWSAFNPRISPSSNLLIWPGEFWAKEDVPEEERMEKFIASLKQYDVHKSTLESIWTLGFNSPTASQLKAFNEGRLMLLKKRTEFEVFWSEKV